jgi:hypothetical protein
MTTRRIAIVGAGAAGLMCAAGLLETQQSMEVLLFEKNPGLGAKVLISGGGRCNVTTGIRDMKQLFQKYPRGSRFLQTAIGKFPPEAVYEWFEERGVPLKIEEDLRVFPQSDNGKDVVGVFEQLFDDERCSLHLKEGVKSVEKEGNTFVLSTEQGRYKVDTLVLTTGGNAYRHTGSTGDGYAFSQALGHSITPLGPSLNSFLTEEEWPKALSGISLPSAGLRAKDDKGKKISLAGPMLFTHFGISGPEVFALSAQIAFREVSAASPVSIHLVPDSRISLQEWQEEIQGFQKEHPDKQMLQCFKGIFPRRFSEQLLEQAGIDPTQKSHSLQNKQLQKLINALTEGLELTLIKRRPGDEFVTAGGVPTSEVDGKSMQSKICQRLFFAGEILDVDGVTGGFNLQASWATGRLAGEVIVGMVL